MTAGKRERKKHSKDRYTKQLLSTYIGIKKKIIQKTHTALKPQLFNEMVLLVGTWPPSWSPGIWLHVYVKSQYTKKNLGLTVETQNEISTVWHFSGKYSGSDTRTHLRKRSSQN